jgi:hypothetical protein
LGCAYPRADLASAWTQSNAQRRAKHSDKQSTATTGDFYSRATGARTGRNKMSDAADNKKDVAPDKAKQASPQEEPMEDEEKIMAGRDDVNYPALLTKDVPGG